MKNEYQVIDRILLTEKGTIQTEEMNKYIFRVHPDANKQEVAQRSKPSKPKRKKCAFFY